MRRRRREADLIVREKFQSPPVSGVDQLGFACHICSWILLFPMAQNICSMLQDLQGGRVSPRVAKAFVHSSRLLTLPKRRWSRVTRSFLTIRSSCPCSFDFCTVTNKRLGKKCIKNTVISHLHHPFHFNHEHNLPPLHSPRLRTLCSGFCPKSLTFSSFAWPFSWPP